jgi:hypothetical protein
MIQDRSALRNDTERTSANAIGSESALIQYYESDPGDQFSADDDDREEIPGTLPQPWRLIGCGSDESGYLTCSHVTPVLMPQSLCPSPYAPVLMAQS